MQNQRIRENQFTMKRLQCIATDYRMWENFGILKRAVIGSIAYQNPTSYAIDHTNYYPVSYIIRTFLLYTKSIFMCTDIIL